jgi:beta-xylosidase
VLPALIVCALALAGVAQRALAEADPTGQPTVPPATPLTAQTAALPAPPTRAQAMDPPVPPTAAPPAEAPTGFAKPSRVSEAPVAYFDWFEYSGHDAIFNQQLPPGTFRNPVLAGFYPDPSITRVGDTFYLVNSTFTYFPGIPVFRSHDLVHWQQIGNVIDRPGQLNFEGLAASRGVFAPTIRYHNGVFYVVTTAVDAGGNFLSVATHPEGPWSDPIWLREVDGIDPSLFFDDDGKAYLVNNAPPAGPPQYDGHRAIWIQQFDTASRRLVGPRKVLLNGGVDIRKKPVWIEGPHLYRHGGWYYLMCAEGGTSTQHSEVILRARSPWGPFQPYAGNPILTQRDLPTERANPITNAGHADLVETPDGSWWAVFLASRPYEVVHYNTGRETFLLPVTWRNGWPSILSAAGLAAFQNENYWYFLGVRRVPPQAGQQQPIELFVEKRSGKQTETISRVRLDQGALEGGMSREGGKGDAVGTGTAAQHVKLKVSANAREYSFYFDADGSGWKPLRERDDGSILSTDVAGGFVGAFVGPYARAE